MSMFVQSNVVEGTKEILKYANHFVAVPYNVKKEDSNAVTENGKKVIKAGTILPSNDGKAVGVVLNDVVIEYAGTKGIAVPLVVHGFIDATKMSAQPSTEAIAALKQITFCDVTP